MRKQWVFYFNTQYSADEVDQFIGDGLTWHGDEWWSANKDHCDLPRCIESETVEARDMDDGIERTKVSVSFEEITMSLLLELQSYAVPNHLLTKALQEICK